MFWQDRLLGYAEIRGLVNQMLKDEDEIT